MIFCVIRQTLFSRHLGEAAVCISFRKRDRIQDTLSMYLFGSRVHIFGVSHLAILRLAIMEVWRIRSERVNTMQLIQPD